MLNWVEHETIFITSGSGHRVQQIFPNSGRFGESLEKMEQASRLHYFFKLNLTERKFFHTHKC